MPLIRKVKCVVHSISDHGGQVYTVELLPENKLPNFHPGQFLHLALDPYDPSGFWPDSRAFSIASPPSDRNHVKISYSVKGKFTTRMQNELAAGREVWVKLPYGEFIVKDTEDVALIAGGTGITAFNAFLEDLKPENSHNIFLFYGARSSDLLIYRSSLEAVSRNCPQFHLELFAEETSDARCITGPIDMDVIWKRVANPMATSYYLAGPPAMVQKFLTDLNGKGVPTEKTNIDKWE
jgi:NAD(P)H-flavin reductase